MNNHLINIVSRAMAASSDIKLDLPPTIIDPGAGADLQQTLTRLIFAFLAAAAFAGIVYSGFIMITAGSDAAKFASGRKNLLWSIIGIMIVILAYFIINFVYKFVGGVIK